MNARTRVIQGEGDCMYVCIRIRDTYSFHVTKFLLQFKLRDVRR